MDNVVQMNASLVQEATAAATSMASQATGLARAVAQFRLEEGSLAALAAAEPAMPAPAPAAPMVQAPRPAPETKLATAARRDPALAADDDDWKEF
jgi:methyl-accepting chemotaxis protein